MSAFIAARARPSLAERLADLAVEALIDEADLSPKPALVDRRGSGAHRDLDLKLMHASARALWPAFHAMAEAAGDAELGLPLRETIGRLGREGEARMLAVTGGVNTHRGAIWALGLLVTAAALEPSQAAPQQMSLRAARLARLEDRQIPAQAPSHGERVRQRYGVRGAREEAQCGFPGVLHHGLPQLKRSRRAGFDENHARLDALLAIMAQLADTCVLHRAGLEGLACMQHGARMVLDAGGSATLAGRRCLKALEHDLLALDASPGGAADLLAATLFLDRLEPMLGAPIGSL
ncbi:triphosphoribosyl-dephospho-CoA synthase [Azotobacter salinestris]|uniref:triphosphoribosyl-dephospho-CoA synthase n=1 Tax=Azotobacter salinestris TaxID=69964 RepID=UPI0032DFD988